jgi:5'-nucleotidase / UDP-sugar diphosphatase
VGGVARRATKIAEERKSGKPVLVLDAGDSLMGDRDPALKTQGASSIEAMNLLGYDAIAIGPQDLELGTVALRSRIAEAKFAVLSANAVDRDSKALLAKPYVIRNLNGHRVVIVGLSGADDTDAITVQDPLAAVKAVVAETEAQADEIIILSTASLSVNREIADSVGGVTAIVEGGSGASTKPWVSSRTGTPIFHADQASAGHAGRNLGLARMKLDGNGDLKDYSWKQFSLGPEVLDDAAMAAWVKTQTGN